MSESKVYSIRAYLQGLIGKLILLFFLLQAGSYAFLEGKVYLKEALRFFHPAAANPVYSSYPHLSMEQVDKLLAETWLRPLAMDPITGVKEKPFTGEYVNVHHAGFRIGVDPQVPWPPVKDPNRKTVFVFGGSAVFGYGLPDQETLPAAWEKRTGDRVYNFAQGFHYSSQELMLFVKLLRSGFVPDLAVFIDGMNEFHFLEESGFTFPFEEKPSGHSTTASKWQSALETLPHFFLFESIQRQLNNFGISLRPTLAPKEKVKPKATYQSAVDRYITNKNWIKFLAKEFGVKTKFVVQPVPTFDYDLQHHVFFQKAGGWGKHESSALGYPVLEKNWKEGKLGSDTIWCADIQKGFKGGLYVDITHYSPKLIELLLNCLISKL